MIAGKDRAQHIKSIVEELKARDRAEHWVVVSGTARVINGEKSFLVTENQSTYVPVGQVHALENPGTIPPGAHRCPVQIVSGRR